MQESLEFVEEIIHERKPIQHVIVNVAKIVMMQKDNTLREIVNSCGLINADGQGVVWGADLLGVEIPERVAGIDLFTNIANMASAKSYKLYFLGAHDEVVDMVIATFTAKYSELKVVGKRNGYFSEDEEGKVVEEVRNSNADILFVAMTSPKKEIFLIKYVDYMGVPFVMGVGGSFDVIAGVTKRAPVRMQNTGLEWFFRILCEPKRLWRRYLVTNSIFLGMIFKAVITGKKRATMP